jgi:uncharacterized membrane protein YfcA
MELTFLHFLIVCPLVGVAGFIDAIAGGGGLISLPAYLISGLPVHTCIATNKMSSCMGTAVATAKYARSGYVDWRLGAFCAAIALAGASLGAHAALLISEELFRILMLIILPLTALYVMRKKDLFSDKNRRALSFLHSVLLSSVIAFALGLYDGFYGPGTGTFLILLFTWLTGMDMVSASATAKPVNLASNIASLVTRIAAGCVVWQLAIPAMILSMTGGWLGSKLALLKGARLIRYVMLGVLALLTVKLALEWLG